METGGHRLGEGAETGESGYKKGNFTKQRFSWGEL